MPKKEKTNWDNVNMQGFVLDGYVKANNQIFREIALKTNPQTAMLYLVLLSHRNTKTNNCYPSKELLSREMGVCERTIGNMLRIPVKRRARSGGTVRPFQRKRRSRSILNGVKRRPSVLSDQRSQFLTELRPLVS